MTINESEFFLKDIPVVHKSERLEIFLNDYIFDRKISFLPLEVEKKFNSYDSNLVVKQLPHYKDPSPWSYDNAKNIIYNTKNNYFKIMFYLVSAPRGREEKKWCQPLLVEQNTPAGILAQFYSVKNNEIYWLVQLKSEPGDIYNFNITTTIQSTFQNINAPKHYSKIKFLPLLKKALEKKKILFSTIIQEDGGRYFQKSNHLIGVEINYDTSLLNSNYCWLSSSELMYILRTGSPNISAQLRFAVSQFYG
jgi:hypothetical protein